MRRPSSPSSPCLSWRTAGEAVFSRNATPGGKQSAAAKLIELTSRRPLNRVQPRREIAHRTQKFRLSVVSTPDRISPREEASNCQQLPAAPLLPFGRI